MKESNMSDKELKSVLKNSALAVIRITVHFLHFALIPMKTIIP